MLREIERVAKGIGGALSERDGGKVENRKRDHRGKSLRGSRRVDAWATMSFSGSKEKGEGIVPNGRYPRWRRSESPVAGRGKPLDVRRAASMDVASVRCHFERTSEFGFDPSLRLARCQMSICFV